MLNSQIATAVDGMVKAMLAGQVVKPADQPVIDAASALLINLLQNINDIAEAARATTLQAEAPRGY